VVVAYRDWAAARGALPRPTLDAVAIRADEVPLPRPEAPAPVSPLRAVTVSHQPPPPASADPLLDAARASVRAELGELMPSPPPADGERGSIDVRSMLVVVVALAVALPLGVVVAGCPSVLRDPTIAPPPAPADAGSTTCHNGAPWRFTAGAWSQADRQCNRLATDASAVVCCATPSAMTGASIHACVPQSLCSPEVTP
jgi:hypothetical protein